MANKKKAALSKGSRKIDESDFLHNEIVELEKKHSIISGMGHFPRVSSGILVYDVIFGGGLVPGMITLAGDEGSAKSTTMLHVADSFRHNVKYNFFFDAENAVEPVYTSNIMDIDAIEDAFIMPGYKGSRKGRIYYYDNNVIEKVFEYMQSFLNLLPDRVYRPDIDGGAWFSVFGRKDRDKQLMERAGLVPDKTLFQDSGQYWCRLGDGENLIQAGFFVDSWANMVTEDVDEEADEGNSLGLEARTYAKFIKRVRGKMRKKAAVLCGVNQIRKKIMAQKWEQQWYETSGEALKFASDIRCKLTPRRSPDGWEELEPSIFKKGVNDEYMYKHIMNIKNKTAVPKRQGWMRVWTSDHEGQGRGVDKVFDTFQYLQMTGQLARAAGKIKLNLAGHKSGEIVMQYPDFKVLLLSEIYGLKKLAAKKLAGNEGLMKLKIRAHCENQIKTKKFNDLLINSQVKDTDKDEEA